MPKMKVPRTRRAAGSVPVESPYARASAAKGRHMVRRRLRVVNGETISRVPTVFNCVVKGRKGLDFRAHFLSFPLFQRALGGIVG